MQQTPHHSPNRPFHVMALPSSCGTPDSRKEKRRFFQWKPAVEERQVTGWKSHKRGLTVASEVSGFSAQKPAWYPTVGMLLLWVTGPSFSCVPLLNKQHHTHSSHWQGAWLNVGGMSWTLSLKEKKKSQQLGSSTVTLTVTEYCLKVQDGQWTWLAGVSTVVASLLKQLLSRVC